MESRSIAVVFVTGLVGCAEGISDGARPSAVDTGSDAVEIYDVVPTTSDKAPARVEELSANESHVCARLVDGRIFCWGDLDTNACLGKQFSATPNPTVVATLSNSGVTRLALNGPNCALYTDGAVACWGRFPSSWMGTGAGGDGGCNLPRRVGLDGIQQVATGFQHACVVRSGEVWCWGNNSSLQSLPDWDAAASVADGGGVVFPDIATPTRVPGIADAVHVSVSQPTCALLKTGRVSCWGADPWRPDDPTRPPSPALVEDLTSVEQIVSGPFTGFARVSDGRVLRFSASMRKAVAAPEPIEALAGSRELFSVPWQRWTVDKYSGGGADVVIGVDAAGAARSHVANSPRFDRIGDALSGVTGVRLVALAQSFVCVVIGDDDVRCAGKNEFGQLGDGTYSDRDHLAPAQWPTIVR